jgi:hypothetical protein
MAFNILLVWKKLPSLRLSGFYMLPRQFFFVYPPQNLRSGITFPIISENSVPRQLLPVHPQKRPVGPTGEAVAVIDAVPEVGELADVQLLVAFLQDSNLFPDFQQYRAFPRPATECYGPAGGSL